MLSILILFYRFVDLPLYQPSLLFFLYNTEIYIYIYTVPSTDIGTLDNMSIGGFENKAALFILFIFHLTNSHSSNLSLK